MSDSPEPKTVVLLVLYMIIVYTVVNGFSVVAYSDFSVGGDELDGLLVSPDAQARSFTSLVDLSNNDNMSNNEKWDYMNQTYGVYKGKLWIFDWLNTGWHYVWTDDGGNDVLKLKASYFDKFLAGSLSQGDLTWIDQVSSAFGSVAEGINYVLGLLTFDIIGSTLSDGSEIPLGVAWIPLLMVTIPWIIIMMWLLPYLIKLIQAIGGLIPFT